tara:strand:- start:377 stop:562 length:186 start_codon:yes stop_codon:yes gene_type:complete
MTSIQGTQRKEEKKSTKRLLRKLARSLKDYHLMSKKKHNSTSMRSQKGKHSLRNKQSSMQK